MKTNKTPLIIMTLVGLLIIASLWMPWFELMGKTANAFVGDDPVWAVFAVCGALIIVMALINRKWSAAVSILFSLVAGGLGVKYYYDATHELQSILGGSVHVGIGIYTLIFAGLLGIIGAVLKLFSRKKEAVVIREKFGEGFGEYTR